MEIGASQKSARPSRPPEGPPAWELAHGSIWRIERPGEAPLFMRALEGAPSPLVAGAVLQHAAALEAPQVWGPQAWGTDEERFWIVERAPEGAPLSADSGREPIGFCAALKAWAPLARAIARGHARGAVHGAIAPWTVWSSGERLCAIDAGCWVGDRAPQGDDAIWWPPEMVRAPIERVPTPFADIYALARLLSLLAWGDGAARSGAIPEGAHEGLRAGGARALERAISPDPSRRPARLVELIEALCPGPARSVQQAPRVSVLSARIGERAEIEHAEFGAGIRFRLGPHGASSEGEAIGAFFYENLDRALYDSVRWGWEGAEMNLLDVRRVTDSRGRAFLTGHPEAVLVLEPHYPITVSDAIKAERCTSRVLVDERDAGPSSRALVFGNIVHGLLDDLATAREVEFERAWAERARSARLDALAAGLDDTEIAQMREQARAHFEHLRALALGPGHGQTENHVEVTRYSPRYGLEGRIDLATASDDGGVRIVELKSGSPWDGHLSQVRCYTLLWDGLARERGVDVTGYLLYSRAGRIKSVPMDDISRERRILRARNELVTCHRAGVDPSLGYRPPAFMERPSECRAGACRFRRARCREQTELLGLGRAADPAEATRQGGAWEGFAPDEVERIWAYWRHFDKLLDAERWAQHAAMGEVLDAARLERRIEEGWAASGLELTRRDDGALELRGLGAPLFSPGRRVLLHRGDVEGSHILQAEVLEASADRLVVAARGAWAIERMPSSGWVVDRLPVRIGVRGARRALFRAIRTKSAPLMRALCAPHEATALFEEPHATQAEPEQSAARRAAHRALNPLQERAARLACRAPLGALIQGPPGTGKTTAIAEIVARLMARGERVLVCAQTNTAVDTLLAKALEAGLHSFLRVGRPERSAALVAALEREGADPTLFFDRSVAARAQNLAELARALEGCRLFGATAYALVSSPTIAYLRGMSDRPPFDTAIVDEASQLNEPMTLAAVALAGRFVLVGDHRQLPPIVNAEQAVSAFRAAGAPARLTVPGPLAEAGCAGLDRSLFERLRAILPCVMLEEQYRMHAEIMAMPSRSFYGGRLRAHPSAARRTLELAEGALDGLELRIARRLDPERPLVVEDIEGTESERANRAEVEAIVETAVALLGAAPRSRPPTIGVISPFRAQVHALRAALERAGVAPGAVDVDTVERFQGGERDVIMVSFVKTERASEFIAEPRRLNVALTRARRKLILFGRASCLATNPLLEKLFGPSTRPDRA